MGVLIIQIVLCLQTFTQQSQFCHKFLKLSNEKNIEFVLFEINKIKFLRELKLSSMIFYNFYIFKIESVFFIILVFVH